MPFSVMTGAEYAAEMRGFVAALNPPAPNPPPAVWPGLEMPPYSHIWEWVLWQRDFDKLAAYYGFNAVAAQYLPQSNPADNPADAADLLDYYGYPSPESRLLEEFPVAGGRMAKRAIDRLEEGKKNGHKQHYRYYTQIRVLGVPTATGTNGTLSELRPRHSAMLRFTAYRNGRGYDGRQRMR